MEVNHSIVSMSDMVHTVLSIVPPVIMYKGSRQEKLANEQIVKSVQNEKLFFSFYIHVRDFYILGT